MILSHFIECANSDWKREKRSVVAMEFQTGFEVRLENKKGVGCYVLKNKNRGTRRFKSINTVFNLLKKNGYEGVLKVGVSYEDEDWFANY